MRPPTTPPSANAHGSSVAHHVITTVLISAQFPAALRSLHISATSAIHISALTWSLLSMAVLKAVDSRPDKYQVRQDDTRYNS